MNKSPQTNNHFTKFYFHFFISLSSAKCSKEQEEAKTAATKTACVFNSLEINIYLRWKQLYFLLEDFFNLRKKTTLPTTLLGLLSQSPCAAPQTKLE